MSFRYVWFLLFREATRLCCATCGGAFVSKRCATRRMVSGKFADRVVFDAKIYVGRRGVDFDEMPKGRRGVDGSDRRRFKINKYEEISVWSLPVK